MQTVQLQPLPSQLVTVTLADQPCTISVRQTAQGLFLSLLVNGAPIITDVVCLNAVAIVRSPYLGFVGDLAFVDTHGSMPPFWTGLGSRWFLGYFAPSELGGVK